MKQIGTITLIVILCSTLLGSQIWIASQPESAHLSEEFQSLRKEYKELSSRTANLEDMLANRSLPGYLSPPPKHRGKINPTSPDKSWTVDQLLTAYLQAETWPERLVLLRNPAAVRPHLEALYDKQFTRPSSFQIHPTSRTLDADKPLYVEATVGNEVVRYVVVMTRDGPRIDWLASKQEWELDAQKLAKRKEQEFIEKWNLQDATILTKLLRKEQSGSILTLHIQITNSSQAYLNRVRVEATLFDRGGRYLDMQGSYATEVPPGATSIVQVRFVNRSLSKVSDILLGLDGVSVKNRIGETHSADEWFELLEE